MGQHYIGMFLWYEVKYGWQKQYSPANWSKLCHKKLPVCGLCVVKWMGLTDRLLKAEGFQRMEWIYSEGEQIFPLMTNSLVNNYLRREEVNAFSWECSLLDLHLSPEQSRDFEKTITWQFLLYNIYITKWPLQCSCFHPCYWPRD